MLSPNPGRIVVAVALASGLQPSAAPIVSWREGQELGRSGPTVVWRVPGHARGMPAADPSSVYFLTASHEVTAIDRDSGVVRWQAKTGEQGARTSGSSVARSGSRVVVGDYNVIAFDAATGTVEWRFVPTDGYAPGIFLGAVTEETVYTGSPDARLFAIDAATGSLAWATTIPAAAKTTVFEPIIDAGRLFAAYTTFTSPPTGGVMALDALTGRIRWRTPFPAPAARLTPNGAGGGPTVFRDVVISASTAGAIHAFDRIDGSVRWWLPAEDQARIVPVDPARPDFRALARAGRVLVAASLTGRVNAFNLETREHLWRTPEALIGSAGLRIAVDTRRAYVPYLGGTLRALSLADGSEHWRIGGDHEEFLAPPVAVDGELYAGSTKAFYRLQ